MSEERTVSELVEQVDEVATDGIFAVEPPAPPAPDPEPEPQAAPEPDGVELALNALTAKLADHQRLIERQAEVAANLHAENQRLRGGELRQAQSALVTSILRVLDDATQMAETAKVPESRED